MNYDELWYKMLKLQVKDDYKLYKKITREKFVEESNKILKDTKHVKISIKNNNVEFIKDVSTNDSSRFVSAKEFISNMLEYVKKNNLEPIEGEFIFRFTDSCDFNINIPVMSYSKPKNIQGFLFPDFNMNMLEEKKKEFAVNCTKTKQKKIYFKGKQTSKHKTQIREKLGPLSNDILDININKDEFKPYYDICNYKYVLDLPGNYPWSVRLIELYMSKSLPFRVNFYASKLDQWIQFYEKMFPENESYINFKYNNYYKTPINNNTVLDIKNKLISKFFYYEKHPEEYYKIVDNNYKKIKSFTMDHISYYLYTLFRYYNKLIVN